MISEKRFQMLVVIKQKVRRPALVRKPTTWQGGKSYLVVVKESQDRIEESVVYNKGIGSAGLWWIYLEKTSGKQQPDTPDTLPTALSFGKAMTKPRTQSTRADDHHDDASLDARKKRTFRKFSYRGIDLDKLLDLSSEQLMDLVNARPRRRFQRGLKRKPMGLIKKLRQAKKDAPALEKPAVVKTHLRNMIVVPEMIGSIVGVYNGKTFNQVEIKPEMIGHYLGEFSITYKPVKHGRPGIGATHSSRFIPLK
ncbi:ribosomal protein S15 [Mortierella sp. NVP85]|nr:ribosomal protein S15 [Mortierella sp. NVP85]